MFCTSLIGSHAASGDNNPSRDTSVAEASHHENTHTVLSLRVRLDGWNFSIFFKTASLYLEGLDMKICRGNYFMKLQSREWLLGAVEPSKTGLKLQPLGRTGLKLQPLVMRIIVQNNVTIYGFMSYISQRPNFY